MVPRESTYASVPLMRSVPSAVDPSRRRPVGSRRGVATLNLLLSVAYASDPELISSVPSPIAGSAAPQSTVPPARRNTPSDSTFSGTESFKAPSTKRFVPETQSCPEFAAFEIAPLQSPPASLTPGRYADGSVHVAISTGSPETSRATIAVAFAFPAMSPTRRPIRNRPTPDAKRSAPEASDTVAFANASAVWSV